MLGKIWFESDLGRNHQIVEVAYQQYCDAEGNNPRVLAVKWDWYPSALESALNEEVSK